MTGRADQTKLVKLYDDVIHVRIVMATAIMAIARKVIIMDFKQTDPGFA